MNTKTHIKLLEALKGRGHWIDRIEARLAPLRAGLGTAEADALKAKRDHIIAEMKKGINKGAKATGPAFVK